ncbi:protein OXIDATIVE STRESS 3-like [Magnolia sinica]|uniref:protein OXIDATIVE STRESS 3-like n=1 Tax=Magnolia sinica TaxID=86752 RepID=UPI002658BFB9|nr:protein OXIDATIVE STRESS 3-like [Magnolia sinica]
MDASFNTQNKHGIMDDEHGHHLFESSLSSSSDLSSDSVASFLSDSTEEVTSSASSSSSDRPAGGSLYEMSSLMEQLPFKRGLSKYFQGKSQSFTSLSNVKCIEELAKPENPYKKKLKSCKSYGGGLDSHRSHSPGPSSKTISKKSSRSSCSSLNARRNGFLANRPPIPTHRTSSLSNQTPLFA